MRTLEKTLCVLAIASYVFVLLFWQGGEFMTFCSLGTLGVFYLLFSFALLNGIGFRGMFRRRSYAGIPPIQVVGAISAGVILSIACFSIVFSVLLWVARSFLLFSSVIFCVTATLISAVYVNKSVGLYYKRVLTRVIPYAAICIILLVSSPRKLSLHIIYRHHPAFIEAVERDWANHTQENAERMEEERRKMRHH